MVKNNKNIFPKESLLKSGIPLEVEIYSQLAKLHLNKNANKTQVNWVEAGYSFPSLDKEGNQTTRSIDFIVSIGQTGWDPDFSWLLYLLIECKSTTQNTPWLFMADLFPKENDIFGQCHTYLYQGKEPSDPQYKREIAKAVIEDVNKASSPTKNEVKQKAKNRFIPCVRGFDLGKTNRKDNEDDKDAINNGLNQLRDALHSVAIERFASFVKTFDPVRFMCFVPILVTNASVRLLNNSNICPMENISDAISHDDISNDVGSILCRVPPNFSLVKNKYQAFINQYREYDLKYFKKSLPLYRDLTKQNIENHMTNFFERTPSYAYVLNKDNLQKTIEYEVNWINQLKPE
jgi:hypothetical protein